MITTKRTMMRMNKSLAVVSSDWDNFVEKKSER